MAAAQGLALLLGTAAIANEGISVRRYSREGQVVCCSQLTQQHGLPAVSSGIRDAAATADGGIGGGMCAVQRPSSAWQLLASESLRVN